MRPAYVVLPAWYGPRDHPPVPLVISPHGRGVDARANVRLWGDLPARGPFAVVDPEGQGRRLELYSWGDPGQIRDLADMPRVVEHYGAFRSLRYGPMLQLLARVEIGGTPRGDPRAYQIRSPFDVAGRIAFSGVPLQIWWSTRDRVVADRRDPSGALYRAILARNPEAPVVQVVGEWRHCAVMHWNRRLPDALRRFGLLPTSGAGSGSA